MRYRLDIHENCPMSSSAELCRVATAYVEQTYLSVQNNTGYELRDYQVKELTLSQFAPGKVVVRCYGANGMELLTFVLEYDKMFNTWKLCDEPQMCYDLSDLLGATICLLEMRRIYR